MFADSWFWLILFLQGHLNRILVGDQIPIWRLLAENLVNILFISIQKTTFSLASINPMSLDSREDYLMRCCIRRRHGRWVFDTNTLFIKFSICILIKLIILYRDLNFILLP